MNLYSQIETGVMTGAVACDLRSDTVTRPCVGMRKAMADAEVGDDVYGDDPTVNRLEATLAELLGKEAAMFVSSGTQSNLCAIMAHCGRGEEVITGDQYHVFIDEAAGASVLAGVALFPLKISQDHALAPASITAAVKDDDPHCPITRLVSLENTVHGKAIPLDKFRASATAARQSALSVHLDGARFFNAVTEIGCSANELAEVADTVSVCLSKGLGAPLGSVLLGNRELIAKARRHRKILGGGMRQAGIAAAAGLFALENNVRRLGEDHERAAALADFLNASGLGIAEQATNMVFFTPNLENHMSLHTHMAEAAVKIGGQYPKIRMVLHKDVDDHALDYAMKAFKTFSG